MDSVPVYANLDLERLRAVIPYYSAAALAGYSLYRIYFIIFPNTALRKVPGPIKGHVLLGHMAQTFKSESCTAHQAWADEYGPVTVFGGFLNKPTLMLTDLRALSHVLQRTEVYQKPAPFARFLTRLLGGGILVAEDELHRVQRKAMNPAFGPLQIRDQTGIFLDKANQLKHVLLVAASTSSESHLEVHEYLSRATLDIIGLAGFGYDFNALEHGSESDELSRSFSTIFKAFTVAPISSILSSFIPGFSMLPTKQNRVMATAKGIMNRIGNRLLAERKASAALEAAQGEKVAHSRARDLLSLLVKANLASNPRERLSDADVLAQIPTFLLAGHDTTSNLLSWALLELAANPSIQASLREECRANPLPATSQGSGSAPLEADELSALDKLPVLDAVIRETLRLRSPVGSAQRAAVKDDVIPLARPYVDRDGVVQESIKIKQGDNLYVPIILVNRLTEIWGPDANEWKPERWMHGSQHAGVSEAVKGIPGVWGNMLTFLGGSRGCIGFRFALYEAKILLHTLITTVSFELARPREDYMGVGDVVQRPMIRSELDKGLQLPLVVRQADDA